MPPGVRPTGARVREALFSIWAERLQGARFLDLFAGSGAVGLEALGRGAAEVVLVESDRRIARVAAANAARLATGSWRIVVATLPAELGELGGQRFELVFADPPYAFEAYERLIAGVAEVLAPGGALAVEHSARVALPRGVAGLELGAERRYGDTSLSIFGAPSGGAAHPKA